MNRRSLAALVVLNLVLVAALVLSSFTTEQTFAQEFGANGGNYTMLSGKISGRSKNDGIYIIQLNTGKAIAAYYDGSSKKFKTIRGVDIAQKISEAPVNR
ncbi:hypothetical protein JD969_05675 [Planctomycetota bacterium]|nr:hypothetical protein JD969_05675 [Planctomycetota bacterium]